jgi:hypothetical protein
MYVSIANSCDCACHKVKPSAVDPPAVIIVYAPILNRLVNGTCFKLIPWGKIKFKCSNHPICWGVETDHQENASEQVYKH